MIFSNALRTFEVVLMFEEWYKDIRCQVCKLLSQTVSGRGSYENLFHKQVGGMCFLGPNQIQCPKLMH
jgi:hypothetical protein